PPPPQKKTKNKTKEEEPCGKLLKKTPAGKYPVFKPARSPGFQIGARTPELAGVRVDAGAPSEEAVKALLDRCPAIHWDGVGPVSRYQKYLARGLRALVEPFHPGLFDPGFVWRTEDEVRMDLAKEHIVIQTHLEGLPAKRSPAENWRAVIKGVRDRHPEAAIHVLDPAGASLAGKGIIIQDRLTFPQAIRLVERCSLLISVDSWSKYVAGWKNIPQLVIVPDQTSDYPQLTASAVWRHSFRGLHKNKNLTLLGLAPQSTKQARYTFGPISALRPGDVLRSLPTLPTL
ncbi:MAG: hypothetical protein NTV93_04350, partial [Verrucomicrobia bacterium]|nr:hypothetical protein [Verrucomicrobiota bacterium]